MLDVVRESFNFFALKGRLYITVPAHMWLWSNHDSSAGHFARYNIYSLTSLIRNAGLKIEYSTYFFSYLSIAIFLSRTLPYRLGLRRKKEISATAKMQVTQEQHKPRKGILGWLMKMYFEKERRHLMHGRISHGASIMIVCCPL